MGSTVSSASENVPTNSRGEDRMKGPLMIVNQNKPPGRDIPAIIDRAALNVSLRPNEVALLTYYANQSTGFRPAKKTICDATGIDPANIKRYRRSLHHLSIIVVSEKHRTITINWPVIRGYALLKRPLDLDPHGGRSYFRPLVCFGDSDPPGIEYLRTVDRWMHQPYYYAMIGTIDDCYIDYLSRKE